MKNANWKKAFTAVLAASMAITMLASCGNESSSSSSVPDSNASSAGTSSEASLTRVENPVTLKLMITEDPDWALTNDISTWKKVAEETNVSIEWVSMPAADAATVYTTTMAAGKSNWPDLVVYKLAQLTTDGEVGAYAALDDLLTEKMPNVLDVMMQDPASFITVPSAKDNQIYAIPSIGLSRNARSWMIRGDWLKDLGLEEPDTIEEFTDCLRAFRDNDPGNAGEFNTPLVIRGGIQSLFVDAMAAYGFNPTVYTRDPDTGICTLNATQPAFREMLEWLKTLYDEKLIDQEFATADAARWESYINNSYAGATEDYSVRTDQFTKNLRNPSEDAQKAGAVADADAELIGLVPLAGPDGDRGIITNSPMNFSNCVAITNNCKDVDAACALINYIYSEDGIKLLSWGEDGVTYNGVDDKGQPNWIEDIGASGQYSIQKTAQYGIQQPYMSRVITDAEVVLAYGDLSMQALEKNRPYWTYPHGPIKWDEATTDSNNTLSTDILPTIIQGVAEFMTGVRPMTDEGWNAFQKELKDLGVDEMAQQFTDGRNAGNEMAKERLAAYGMEAPDWVLDS